MEFVPDEPTKFVPDEPTGFIPDAEDQSSAAGAFGRAAAKEAVPTVVGAAAGGVVSGALAGGVALSELGPGALLGVLGGGIIGGIAAGMAAAKLQDVAIEAVVGDETFKEMRQQEAIDIQEHPWAATAGSLIPQAFLARPSISNLAKTASFVRQASSASRSGSEALKAFVTTPAGRSSMMTAANVLFGAGTQASFSAYDALNGGDTNMARIMTRVLAGALFTGESPFHKSLSAMMGETPEGRTGMRDAVIAEHLMESETIRTEDAGIAPQEESYGMMDEGGIPAYKPEMVDAVSEIRETRKQRRAKRQEDWLNRKIAIEQSPENIRSRAFKDIPDTELRDTLVDLGIPAESVARMKRPAMELYLSEPDTLNSVRNALRNNRVKADEVPDIIPTEEAQIEPQPVDGTDTEGGLPAYKPPPVPEPPPVVSKPKDLTPAAQNTFEQTRKNVLSKVPHETSRIASEIVVEKIPEKVPEKVQEPAKTEEVTPEVTPEEVDAEISRIEAELAAEHAPVEVRPVGQKMNKSEIRSASYKDLKYAVKNNQLGISLNSPAKVMRQALYDHMVNNGHIKPLTKEQLAKKRAQFKQNMAKGKQRKEWESDERAAQEVESLIATGLPEGTDVIIKGDEGFSSWRVIEVIAPDYNDLAKSQLRYMLRDDISGDFREVSSRDVEVAEQTPEVDDEVFRMEEGIRSAQDEIPESGLDLAPVADEGVRGNEESAAEAFRLESASPEELKAEAAKAAQRAELEKRSAQKLEGTSGDLGQMQLEGTGGDLDLFNRPSKKITEQDAQAVGFKDIADLQSKKKSEKMGRRKKGQTEIELTDEEFARKKACGG